MADLVENRHERVFEARPGPGPSDLLLTAMMDLDIATEARADAELRTAFESDLCKRCIVDTSSVFVDVRGASVLLLGARRAAERGLGFAVVPSASLRTICRAGRLEGVLTLLDGPHD